MFYRKGEDKKRSLESKTRITDWNGNQQNGNGKKRRPVLKKKRRGNASTGSNARWKRNAKDSRILNEG